MTTALEQHLAFGAPGTGSKPGCAEWRQANFFDRLPSLAEDLAAGFVHVARRHGNAAGNRWLARNAAELVEPEQIIGMFGPIASDLRRALASMQRREPTTIEGIKAANAWLIEVKKRLVIGSFNATQDDEALIDYAVAKARAIDDERSKLIGNIATHNKRLRNNLLVETQSVSRLPGASVSTQARNGRLARAIARNPLSPAPSVDDLSALSFQPPVKMSLSVADALALKKARTIAQGHGIEPPSRKSPISVQLARLSCSLWWRRKLRRLAGRRLEQVQREAHRVHAQAGIYCSDMTVERRRSQKVRNRALLETLEAINQEGQTYTLAELSELGLANPDHRRAELMLRIRDTEVEARRLGHLGMFYTMTTPSRFHPVVSKNCRRNRKYDGSTPREAQQHLQKLWAKARAKLARDGLAVYGIRVVEPHHDGTPHWHMLVWMKPEHQAAVTQVLQEYAEAESPEELFDRYGNKTEARFKAVTIDPAKGTAAGYVAKYISKNINGEQFMELDKYDHDMADSAPRIEAWAATWGIRQFQFLGLPSVTVWREIRRLTEKQEGQLRDWETATRPEPRAAATLDEIRRAANAGQWDLFLRLMGGPNTPRKLQPIKPWTIEKMDTKRETLSHATGEDSRDITARGRYGEPVKTTWGLVVSDGRGRESEYLTRLYRWEVRPRRRGRDEATLGAGAAGDAWTCVTNCTGVDIAPRNPSPEDLAEQIERFQQWRASEEVRAEMEAVELEAQEVQIAARRLFSQPSKPVIEEEYFPPELC